MSRAKQDLLTRQAEGCPAFNGDVFMVVTGIGNHAGFRGLDHVEDVGLAGAVAVGPDAQVDLVGVVVRLVGVCGRERRRGGLIRWKEEERKGCGGCMCLRVDESGYYGWGSGRARPFLLTLI